MVTLHKNPIITGDFNISTARFPHMNQPCKKCNTMCIFAYNPLNYFSITSVAFSSRFHTNDTLLYRPYIYHSIKVNGMLFAVIKYRPYIYHSMKVNGMLRAGSVDGFSSHWKLPCDFETRKTISLSFFSSSNSSGILGEFNHSKDQEVLLVHVLFES